MSVGIGLPGVSIGINLPVYPELVPVPGYPVYYAPQVNSNYFFYDGVYWVYEQDNWYTSSWYNGPWQLVAPEVVPLFVLDDTDEPRDLTPDAGLALVNADFSITADGSTTSTITVTLKPGQSWKHWWTYKYANQNSSPYFCIRVDGDEDYYRLRSFAVPTTDSEGKVYNIKYDSKSEQFKVYAKHSRSSRESSLTRKCRHSITRSTLTIHRSRKSRRRS